MTSASSCSPDDVAKRSGKPSLPLDQSERIRQRIRDVYHGWPERDRSWAELGRWLAMSPIAAHALYDGENRASILTAIHVANQLGITEFELRTGVALDETARAVLELQGQIRALHSTIELLKDDLQEARTGRGVAQAEVADLRKRLADLQRRAEDARLTDEPRAAEGGRAKGEKPPTSGGGAAGSNR